MMILPAVFRSPSRPSTRLPLLLCVLLLSCASALHLQPAQDPK